MPLLRPFRDYNEKDVINLYTFSGQANTSTIVNRGTLVKIVGDGWRNDTEPVDILGSYGDFSVNNVQALRYGTPAKVTYCSSGTGDLPLGITLFDVRELDENTIPLKYNPRKAAELEACISGQTVPIVTRGTFLISGIQSGSLIVPGGPIYAGATGELSAFSLKCAIGTAGTAGLGNGYFSGQALSPVVGQFLGVTGTDGFCLIKLSL